MHIRVLLSKYRSYELCSACHGARLKPDALLWRIASAAGRGSRERGVVAEGRYTCRYMDRKALGTEGRRHSCRKEV